VELGGALKNIFAIAAGRERRPRPRRQFQSRAGDPRTRELSRLGEALGGQRATFQGLSGIGDLIVTCFSRHSRNRMVGERLGRGEALAAIGAR
jgi:glycerol-3-phosphate dehydrogenase (NAD(P)+)